MYKIYCDRPETKHLFGLMTLSLSMALWLVYWIACNATAMVNSIRLFQFRSTVVTISLVVNELSQ